MNKIIFAVTTASGNLGSSIIKHLKLEIGAGKFNGVSDFSEVAKRSHKSIDEMINEFINQ